MQIHQSAEDYLETILMLSQRMGKVRSIDVVNELGFTKASVSIAMKKLRENGYIAVDGEGNLTLLEPGLEIAQRIYSRHRLLTHFFMQLGVDEQTAAEDACKAEHILSEQTLEKIRESALRNDAADPQAKSFDFKRHRNAERRSDVFFCMNFLVCVAYLLCIWYNKPVRKRNVGRTGRAGTAQSRPKIKESVAAWMRLPILRSVRSVWSRWRSCCGRSRKCGIKVCPGGCSRHCCGLPGR